MEKIFSINDLRKNLIPSIDCIVIPEYIFNIIFELCKKEKEYCGQLLIYKNIVEYPFISGNGNLFSTFPSKKVIFNNVHYSAIEFHTHPKLLGENWEDKFSSGDYTTFENRIIQEGDKYQHVLFTSKNILTYGKFDAPEIRIGFGNKEIVQSTFKEINKKHNCWNFK